MKVCYIITTTINCGPVNVLYDLLNNYQSITDFRPTIITLKPDDQSKSRQRNFEKLGIKVKHFYENKNKFKHILDYINHNDFDVVHSHGLIPDLINHYIKQNEKNSCFHISTLHNYPFEDYVQNHGLILGNLMAFAHLYAIKKLYKVACSNAIAMNFQKIKVKTDVIENGIIFPSQYEGRENKKNLCPIFLYLGRIHDRKNVLFLIDYFQYHPEYEFWIVGDGARYNEVKKRAREINNIRVLGKTEHPIKYYRNTDYYISASKSEGLPLAVLEAMSYGIPCVLSDIEPHKEVLVEDNMGQIFNNNNIKSLDKAIKKVVHTPYDGQAIYNEAKNNFDSNIMMKKYYDIYLNHNGEK